MMILISSSFNPARFAMIEDFSAQHQQAPNGQDVIKTIGANGIIENHSIRVIALARGSSVIPDTRDESIMTTYLRTVTNIGMKTILLVSMMLASANLSVYYTRGNLANNTILSQYEVSRQLSHITVRDIRMTAKIKSHLMPTHMVYLELKRKI